MEISDMEEEVEINIENVKNITKEDLFFKKWLYDKIKISDLEQDIFRWEVDWFSPSNKIETTYKISAISLSGYNIEWWQIYTWWSHIVNWFINYNTYHWIYNINLICKRKNEELTFFIKIDDNNWYIEKIWQDPSIADMVLSKLKNDYSKILWKDWKNFTKAIWLFSHWIWIGSFVYLRRIFEELIFETFEDNKEKIWFSESEFEILRMNEKIWKIKDFLPDFLVENKELYWILSNGIHELSEEDCLEYFPVIQDSIELILDQKIRIKEKQTREKEMKDKIKNITSKIK